MVSDLFSETAWCYLNGVGTKKNLKKSARYYRMAEKQGVKSVGLSWIWKEKYDEGEDRRKSEAGKIPDKETSKKGKKVFGRNNSA